MTQKISINVPVALGARLRKIAFEAGVSKSSIVEISLESLFAGTTDATIGNSLRQRGATLRRTV